MIILGLLVAGPGSFRAKFGLNWDHRRQALTILVVCGLSPTLSSGRSNENE